MADFRAELADLLSGADREKAIALLRDLMEAKRKTRFDCSKCGARNHIEVVDAKTRLEALKVWAEQGLGRPGTVAVSGEPCQAALQLIAKMEGMSDEQLAGVMAGLTDVELAEIAVHGDKAA